MIHPISPDLLDETFLHERVYPDLESTYYWTRSWDPDFYVALARAGFISISHEHPTFGTLLLPEIQNAYAVLDWDDLHVSRKLRKLLRSGRLEPEGLELRIVGPCDRVIERLIAYHGDATWLTPPYRALLSQLPTGECTNFALHGVELWSTRHDELVAGELGYSIGSTYTSLSGFCTRGDRERRHLGTLQMVWLACVLREGGYAFWNMGHPGLAYKEALGARTLPRSRFLERWLHTRDERPRRHLALDEGAERGSRPRLDDLI
ncbi:MAG: GNAT family N-acetyltransferase [Deltaproteobacteria bacterium]|nr:GNAT family N-acetyltransferase [Deltaproteobacteria bacterium]